MLQEHNKVIKWYGRQSGRISIEFREKRSQPDAEKDLILYMGFDEGIIRPY